MKLLKELITICEQKDVIEVKVPKARNKQLNDVLTTRKGGKHYDAKKDYVRAKEKSKNDKALNECTGVE